MGTLIVVAGPSQAGKTTLMRIFMERHPDATRVVTATSRPRRPEEISGVDKFFLSREQFEEHADAFLEIVEEHGNFYGILKEQFLQTIEQHTFSLIDLDFRGVQSVAAYALEQQIHVVFLFVTPETIGEVVERIRLKNDVNAGRRITSAQYEFGYRDSFPWDGIIDTSCPAELSYVDFEREILQKVSTFKDS